ncbi:MAG TPA: ribonuclease III [Silvibacterium sp.]|nr:ribonuclease III [Silvibacterium sp.]
MNETPGSRDELQSLLQHKFAQPELLTRALTHRSLAYEKKLASPELPASAEPHAKNDPRADNEQLEFLGDAVVGFLVAEDLCHRYPDLHEGELTRLRSELVSRKHLGQIALRLNLGAYMLLGRGEERSGGRRKSALLANCIEAVMAALYLDGGVEAARNFILREIIQPSAPALRSRLHGSNGMGDHKSALQELLQSRNHSQPEYAVKAESGPDHRKRFLVEVYVRENGARESGVRGKALARGLGSTKKNAEQEAARRAIAKLHPASGEPS